MKKRYTMAPTTTASVAQTMRREGRMDSPTITAARPMTMVPIPMEMSEPPWVCTNSAPARPTRPLEIAMPSRIMAPVFTPCERAMRALEPVARMARPRSVAKNQSRPSLASTTITNRMTGRIT